MLLSKKQIEDYQNFGVIIIKDVFKEWIEPLRAGFQKVLDNPSKHGRENVTDKKGRFFEDYFFGQLHLRVSKNYQYHYRLHNNKAYLGAKAFPSWFLAL